MRIGIIAGTGMDSLAPMAQWQEAATPYGPAYLASALLGEEEVALLRRHGPALNVPPHLVNYRANLWALQQLGVDRIISTAAVGSMRKDMEPGTLAVVGDFIDFTKRRVGTAFDQPGDGVMHVDFSVPYCPQISSALEESAAEIGIALGRRVVYVCVDGPRYETPAEVRMFTQWGGDVVGMTGVPEVVLAREMGLCYGALAILTNYATGVVDKPLSHEDVIACMTERRQAVHEILTRAAAIIPHQRRCCPVL